MIEGGWPFVLTAYAVAGVALIALVVLALLSARRWAREAQRLDRP